MRDLKTLTLKKELEIKRRNIMTPKWTSALAAVIALALSGISPPSSAAESMDTAAAHQVYSHGAKAYAEQAYGELLCLPPDGCSFRQSIRN